MTITQLLKGLFAHSTPQRNVALVLGGGGARGFAHIGAIEALSEHGYRISSVAGTSMGALVGGLYAAGKLADLREMATHLSRKQIMQLMDISPGLDHIASGRHFVQMLDSLVGDLLIEDLPIPFCCCATDVVSGQETVFSHGPLKMAIRASVSIPCFFKPVFDGQHIYVDGSIHNLLPLDRVQRNEGDLLTAINVCGPDDQPFQTYLKKYGGPENETEKSIWQKLPFLKPDISANYMNMTSRVVKLVIQNSARLALQLNPPDIYAEMPMNTYSLFDFDKATEIILYGKEKMNEVLDAL